VGGGEGLGGRKERFLEEIAPMGALWGRMPKTGQERERKLQRGGWGGGTGGGGEETCGGVAVQRDLGRRAGTGVKRGP